MNVNTEAVLQGNSPERAIRIDGDCPDADFPLFVQIPRALGRMDDADMIYPGVAASIFDIQGP